MSALIPAAAPVAISMSSAMNKTLHLTAHTVGTVYRHCGLAECQQYQSILVHHLSGRQYAQLFQVGVERRPLHAGCRSGVQQRCGVRAAERVRALHYEKPHGQERQRKPHEHKLRRLVRRRRVLVDCGDRMTSAPFWQRSTETGAAFVELIVTLSRAGRSADRDGRFRARVLHVDRVAANAARAGAQFGAKKSVCAARLRRRPTCRRRRSVR